MEESEPSPTSMIPAVQDSFLDLSLGFDFFSVVAYRHRAPSSLHQVRRDALLHQRRGPGQRGADLMPAPVGQTLAGWPK
jgi:hypothetical protein